MAEQRPRIRRSVRPRPCASAAPLPLSEPSALLSPPSQERTVLPQRHNGRHRRRGRRILLGAVAAATSCCLLRTRTTDAFSSAAGGPRRLTPGRARRSNEEDVWRISSPARKASHVSASSLFVQAAARADPDLEEDAVFTEHDPSVAQSHERRNGEYSSGGEHSGGNTDLLVARKGETLARGGEAETSSERASDCADKVPTADADVNGSAEKKVAADFSGAQDDFNVTYTDDYRRRRLAQLERLKEELQQKRSGSSSGGRSSSFAPSSASDAGLSKAHRSLLGPTLDRQRFVTGRYPLLVSVRDDPTRKWLGQTASARLLVNGTSVEKSAASYDRYQWLDDDDRRRMGGKAFSMELIAEIHVRKPGYLNVLPGDGAGSSAKVRSALRESGLGGWLNRWKLPELPSVVGGIDSSFSSAKDDDNGGEGNSAPSPHSGDKKQQESKPATATSERLWITGFSLTKRDGELGYVDVDSGRMGSVNGRTARAIRWPNEVSPVPSSTDGRREGAGGSSGPSSPSGEDEDDDDALLVSDGFLVPGRDKGGLYVVRYPGDDKAEWRVRLTPVEDERRGEGEEGSGGDAGGWFYHRAVWVDLTGDGRRSILTARARIPSLLKKGASNAGERTGTAATAGAEGQLVWLERPEPHRYDPVTGTPLDVDDTVFDPYSARNTPWKVRVLDTGPDVMFAVADLDPTDDTVEVVASNFFDRSVTLHSIRVGTGEREPEVVFRRTLDGGCGAAFSSVLADLDGPPTALGETLDDDDDGDGRGGRGPRVIDSGSTVATLRRGDRFSHVLVTSHECTFAEKNLGANNGVGGAADERDDDSLPDEAFDIRIVNSEDDADAAGADAAAALTSPQQQQQQRRSAAANDVIDGGSLFAYRVPSGPTGREWRTDPWVRTVMATGFRVRGQLGNVINPGAPGFCYTFYPTADGANRGKRWSRPLIGISGDCAEAAYILRPCDDDDDVRQHQREDEDNEDGEDRSARYKLVCEIETGATVGSLGVGYDDFCADAGAEQQSGYAKIYVPCYERDRVLVFAMGTGEEEVEEEEGGGGR